MEILITEWYDIYEILLLKEKFIIGDFDKISDNRNYYYRKKGTNHYENNKKQHLEL